MRYDGQFRSPLHRGTQGKAGEQPGRIPSLQFAVRVGISYDEVEFWMVNL